MISSNINEYEPLSRQEIDAALAPFEPEPIIDTLVEKYGVAFRGPSMFPSQNFAFVIESMFQASMQHYGDHLDELRRKRLSLYNNIIHTMAQLTQLEPVISECETADEAYTKAYFLCDVFMASTMSFVVEFFANYIRKEKNTLYNICTLLNQDVSASSANKKLYKTGDKMAGIVSNIGGVIDNICSFDMNVSGFAEHAFVNKPHYIEYAVQALGGNDDNLSNMLFSNFIRPYSLANKQRLCTELKIKLAPEIPGVNITDFVS